MIRKLLPLLMAIVGAGAGVGAGLLFAPTPTGGAADAEPDIEVAAPAPPAQDYSGGARPEAETGSSDFIRLNNQFVVPILVGERIGAMVVLSLGIEVAGGNAQIVYEREPKLRDGFLQVLFDHANRGGFDGEFTNAHSMDVLRRLLTEVARDLLGPKARSVLITEIARQDT